MSTKEKKIPFTSPKNLNIMNTPKVKSLIHYAECQANAHFGRTETLKINPKPPLHSMATVCKLFECANKGSKPYRLEMSKKVAIDYGLDKWRKRLDDEMRK